MNTEIQALAVIGKILQFDANQAKGLLAKEAPDVQLEVQRIFSTNRHNLKFLFPEFAEVVE